MRASNFARGAALDNLPLVQMRRFGLARRSHTIKVELLQLLVVEAVDAHAARRRVDGIIRTLKRRSLTGNPSNGSGLLLPRLIRSSIHLLLLRLQPLSLQAVIKLRKRSPCHRLEDLFACSDLGTPTNPGCSLATTPSNKCSDDQGR